MSAKRTLGVVVGTILMVTLPIVLAPGRAAATHEGTGRPFVAAAVHPSGNGLWLLDGDGDIHARGSTQHWGDVGDLRRSGRAGDAEAIDVAPSRTGAGYWIFDVNGAAYAFGDAEYHGSLTGVRAGGAGTAPIVAAAVTPSGGGYFLLDAVGGIFTFGDARFHGSVPGLRQAGAQVGDAPGIAFAVTPTGNGYVVLDAEGGVFAFGDARFSGSIPQLRQDGVEIGDARVKGVVMATDGRGYWMTDAVGGVFAFGQTAFHGSMPGRGIPFDLVDTAVMPDGSGYWMLDPQGWLAAFGTAEQVRVDPNLRYPGTVRNPDPAVSAQDNADHGSFAYVRQHSDGSPVRMNPCRTQRYVVHLGSGAPSNGVDLVEEAMRRLSEATGIQFVFARTTSESWYDSGDERAVWNHPRYASGWAPILVSLEPGGSDVPSGKAGVAQPRSIANRQGRQVIVSGKALVATDRGLTPDFAEGGDSMGKLLLHELGHLVGLQHPSDPQQVMWTERNSVGTYQPGDLEGLRNLGATKGCVLEP